MKKNVQKLTACFLAATLTATPAFASAEDTTVDLISDEKAVTLITSAAPDSSSAAVKVSPSPARVSVHDPSVAKDKDGTYYVFGSHIDAAKSSDLVNWAKFTNGYASMDNVLFGDIEANLAKPLSRSCTKNRWSKQLPTRWHHASYPSPQRSKYRPMPHIATISSFQEKRASESRS